MLFLFIPLVFLFSSEKKALLETRHEVFDAVQGLDK